ncbi:MAG: 2-C-methyl-D-erythritol 4-phosphate cytidylyltransferase [Acidimicrobiales bacterium]
MGRVWGVVVAGGSGSRFGEAKQFVSLAGRPVAERSVAACRSVCDRVVLVVPRGATSEAHGADIVVEGGTSRAASVRAGLAALSDEVGIVVVHDAARPLARHELFTAVVAALSGDAAGAIPAVEVSDTVKRVRRDGSDATVLETLDRSELVAVQTPQAFRLDALRRAHQGDPDATDDAALVEALGLRVVVVPGDPENLKLTTPADLVRAEFLAGR